MPFQYRMLSTKQKGLKTSNSVMAKELGMIADDSKIHQAGFDIEMTAYVFFELIKKMEIQ